MDELHLGKRGNVGFSCRESKCLPQGRQIKRFVIAISCRAGMNTFSSTYVPSCGKFEQFILAKSKNLL